MTSPIASPQCSFTPNLNWNRGLPGIDFDRKDLYMPYSAAAPREYADNEGWQVARRRGKAKKHTHAKKRKADVEAQIAAADA